MQQSYKFLFFILVNTISVFSQVKVGQWVDHLSYNSANSVAKVNNIVYVANGQGMAKYNLDDNSIEKFTKIDGLTDVGVKLLRKCEANNNLLVIYSNSNIDVIKPDGSIINVSDIKRKSITGNKAINEVYFKGHFAYLACGFGIIVFDAEKMEIKDTYYIGTSSLNYKVYQVTLNDTAVFAATEKGVFFGKKTANLSFYQNWKSFNSVLPSGPYNAIVNFNGKIVANYSRKLKDDTDVADTLFQYDGTTWIDFPYKPHVPYSYTIKKMYDYTSKYNSIVLIDQWGVQDYNANGSSNNYITNYSTNPPEYADIQDLYYEGQFQFWLADKNYGFLKSLGSGSGIKIPLNGPASNYANDIAVKDGNVVIAPVNLGETFTNQWNSTSPSFYHDGEWKSLRDIVPTSIQDVNAVAIDPNNKEHYAFACMSSGIVDINNNQLTVYTETNTPMVGYLGGGGIPLFVTNIGFDKNSSLWAMMSLSTKPAQVRKKDGTWKLLDFSQFTNGPTMSKAIFTKNNQAWMILARGTGLMVYNDVTGLSTPSAANTKFLSTAKGNGALPSLDIYSICEDNDGRIWIGTQKGVTVFYNPENIFTSSNWDSQQILIEQDGHVQILLQNDKITALAVDGANRKWVGTESSGVYCLSPDGQTQVHHFTKDNSSLYSNIVNSIAIDDTKGDVFIGTDIGVQSYRTSFIKPFDDYSNLHVFPNPVRPSYSGNTYITGLVDESIVKITDVAGHLVWEGKSQGGQIEWNLQNTGGSRVASGVYLINCSTANGEKSGNAKLLVIN